MSKTVKHIKFPTPTTPRRKANAGGESSRKSYRRAKALARASKVEAQMKLWRRLAREFIRGIKRENATMRKRLMRKFF